MPPLVEVFRTPGKRGKKPTRRKWSKRAGSKTAGPFCVKKRKRKERCEKLEKHTGRPVDRDDGGFTGAGTKKDEKSIFGPNSAVPAGKSANAIHGKIRRGRAECGDLQDV